MDDYTESTRKLETLGDMPAVDLTMHEGVESVGENLEAADDDDDIVLEKPEDKMQVDEEEEDPLDAFMTGVNEEVKKVNGHEARTNRLGARVDDSQGDEGPTGDEPKVVDDIDATGLETADILA